MKLLANNLTFLLVVVSRFVLAEDKPYEYIPSEYHQVVKEEFSDKLHLGKCLIKGKVINPFTEEPVQGGIVSNFSRTAYDLTDSSGYYEFELNSQDTSLFFYHEKFNEIIVWSIQLKDQHITTIYFYTSERLPDGVIQVAEKPVIYLYPEQITEVSIQLNTSISLDFTYPTYEDGWHLTAHPDGKIVCNDREYPYLFWEGTNDQLDFKQENGLIPAYFVRTDTIIPFLENILNEFGLTSRESTDFITYWAPRMTAQPYVTIQFLVDEDYSKNIAELLISPKPDNMRRIFMTFSLSSAPIPPRNLIKPVFEGFSREGFVLIEWGGCQLNSVPGL